MNKAKRAARNSIPFHGPRLADLSARIGMEICQSH